MNLTISFRKDDIYFHPILYLCVRIGYGKERFKTYRLADAYCAGGTSAAELAAGGTIGGHVLRRVDILGDVRPVPEVVSEPDSLLPPPPKVKPAFVDTCRSGMTCIEDYSDSTLRGMTPFYRALDELAAKPRPVRIAYFGDSFIEADILTADLRAIFAGALWRLRGRLRDDYFSGQRLSAYGAA